MIDDRTVNLNLPKPNALNALSDDVGRLRTALDGIDTAVAGKQAALGFTAENAANKGVANGYAGLGSDGKVPSGQLPSYVDDVLEYATTAAFPATGEAGKIYVAINTGTAANPTRAYRWSGSTYVEISPSPGTTDNVTEGTTNLYFTSARAKLASAYGVLNKSAAYTVAAADSKSLVRVSTAAGAVTITLPQISTLTQDFDLVIDKITGDTNATTIARSGTDLINGATAYALTSQWDGAWLIADRSTNTWTVIRSGSGGGGSNAVVDPFTGSGTAGPFTLSGDPGSKNNTAVYVGGVYQQKSSYTLAGQSLTLGGTVAAGVSVEVCYSTPLSIGTPADGSVTTAKLATDAVTADKIAASAVGTSELATDSVTADKIAAGAVGTSEIAAGISISGLTMLDGFKEEVFTITDGAAVDLNPANGSVQVWTLGASRSPTATNFTAGQSMTLMINDGTAYTINWPSVTWVGGSAPTLATTGYTVVELWEVGSTLYGALVGSVA